MKEVICMRKWAYLTEPRAYNGQTIYKVMIYEKDDETYVFLYNSLEAQISAADEWYPNLEEAISAWDSYVKNGGWVTIDNPMPGCQEDCVLPIRVKGRDIGKPEWGVYEQFVDGDWVAYVE